MEMGLGNVFLSVVILDTRILKGHETFNYFRIILTLHVTLFF